MGACSRPYDLGRRREGLPFFDRWDFKQTSVRGGLDLSERNINLEDVSKALRNRPSNRRETDERKFEFDLLTDGEPVERMQKWRNMFMF